MTIEVLLSECCGSPPWFETGLCSSCREHADFININKEKDTKEDMDRTIKKIKDVNEFIKSTPEYKLGKNLIDIIKKEKENAMASTDNAEESKRIHKATS